MIIELNSYYLLSAEPGKGIILYMNSQNCFSVGFRKDIFHNYQIFFEI